MLNSYDIETYVNNNKILKAYCVCYIIKSKEYYNYWNSKTDLIIDSIEFIFTLISKKDVIYVHNLNFDGRLILESITRTKTYKFNALIKDDNIYSITIVKNKKEICFRCSYKILPQSLNKIAKSFALDHKKMIFPYKFSSFENLFYVGDIPSTEYFNSSYDYSLFIQENNSFNFKEYSINYCMNDVRITSRFIYKIRKIINKYSVKINNIYSAPSLSLAIFNKKFNNNKISYNMKYKNQSFIKRSYFGGRCEVYGNPKNNEYINYYDFSGMYGQCMMEKFPFGKVEEINKPKNFEKPGFYYIKYESNMNIPILPHRSFKDDKLLFVNGINHGIFWFEEIEYFIEMGGRILDIKYAVLYSNYDYIFTDFVSEFNKIREIDEVHKTFAKLIINSLYGRMGMNDIDTNTEICEIIDISKKDLKYNIKSYIELNNYAIIEYYLDKNNHRKVKKNLAIASSITSKARLKLYKAQRDVINNGGRLLYSDTDSIFASYKKDVSKEKHGVIDWSKEKIKIKDAVFVTAKTYALLLEDNSEIIKIKGFDNFKTTFNDIKNSFYDKREIGFKETEIINKKGFFMKIDSIDKIMSMDGYIKRKFTCNYTNTEPLKIEIKENGFQYI